MEHTWKIYDLKRNLADGVVTKVTYACESVHDKVRTRKIGEFDIIGNPSDDGFIAYDNLTEVEVLNWVNGNVDKSAIEAENATFINNRIAARAARTSGTGTPW